MLLFPKTVIGEQGGKKVLPQNQDHRRSWDPMLDVCVEKDRGI